MIDLKYPGAIDLIKAENYTLIGNVVAGSEKIGIKTRGEKCSDTTASDRVRDNEVIGCLHGIHVPGKAKYSVRTIFAYIFSDLF